MREWQTYSWADDATEATIAVVGATDVGEAQELLRPLGPTDEGRPMDFEAALDLQGSFYEDDTFDQRAVLQVDRVDDSRGWWGVVEPNGFRASDERHLLALARGGHAVSFFWNVNAVMSLLRVDNGAVVARFDPLIEVVEAAQHAPDLPFEDHPRAASFALISRWTGVTITERWVTAAKPTFVVQTPHN